MIYRLTWFLCRVVFHTLLRWRITGAENVPVSGAVLLASNHISVLDPLIVSVGFWRPTRFMAKEELFRHPLFAWYISHLNAFPVKRGAADRAAIKYCLDSLEQGWALAMFPEGTRSDTGELREAEMGVGMIACRSGVPVIPVYLTGANRVLPKGGGFRLAQITVAYGKPLHFQNPEGKRAGREEYEDAARQVMAAIAALRDEGATPPSGRRE